MAVVVVAAVVVAAVSGGAGCLEPGERAYYPERDTTPPRILATYPVAGGTIGPESALLVTFSEALDTRSLVPGITIYDQFQVQYPLLVGYPVRTEPPALDGPTGYLDPDAGVINGWEVTLRPRNPLPGSRSDLTLLVRTLISDEEGNPLPEELRVTFSTSSE
jgi:hypothetical protein